MINYEVNHQLMNNLKGVIEVLGKNRQAIFTAVELSNLQKQLNECKPVTREPKPIPEKDKTIIPMPKRKEAKKEVKNDTK